MGSFRRIFRVFGVRPDPERELDEELRVHFEMTEAALRRQGLSEEEARREARRRFGDVRRHRRAMMRLDEGRWRMTRVRNGLEEWVGTVRTAGRSMRRSPAFTLAVVVTLGLGLGANAVMFGVVDRLLLSPPQHVTRPDDVRRIYERRVVGGGENPSDVLVGRYLTFGDYRDLTQVDGFASAAAYTASEEMVLGSGEGAVRVRVVRTTPSLFAMLGPRPALGRFLTPEEDRAGAPPAAVISHEFWTRRFGADPEVVGTALAIGPAEWEVVGVAPAGFTGVELSPVDVWLPLTTFAHAAADVGCLESRNCWWLMAAVRLTTEVPESVAMEQATALHVAARAEQIAAGGYDPNARLLGAPLQQGSGPAPSTRASVSRWLAGVSLIVLLIACANVANLLLARAVRLRRERAVRVALGASRGRLLADLLVESLLLAGLGALAALLIGHFGSGALHRALIPDVAFVDTGLARRLASFLAVATIVTAALAGLMPALHASRTAGQGGPGGLRGGAGRRSRLQVGLLVAQAALSVVLLIGAGLFVRSLGAASGLDLGYDADRVVLVQIEWNGRPSAEERAGIYRTALERVRARPGVATAAATFTVPFASSVSVGRPRVPGVAEYPRNEGGGPYVNKVGAGYFEALGIDLVKGRGFQAADDADGAAPVAVLSARMADDLWPAGDAVGRCIHLGEASPCTEVVGVVADHRRESLVEAVPHHLYYVNLHHPDVQGPPQGLMVRAATGSDPRLLARDLRAVLAPMASTVRFVQSRVLAENVDPQLRSWRLGATMFSVFGLLALVVAAIGLYSVLAFDVAERRRELGVRAALGASRNSILGMVVRSALTMTGAGLGLGVAFALGVARFIEPLLFRVSPTDSVVYGAVVLLLLGVAGAAGLAPGLRATRVDPAESLRAE